MSNSQTTLSKVQIELLQLIACELTVAEAGAMPRNWQARAQIRDGQESEALMVIDQEQTMHITQGLSRERHALLAKNENINFALASTSC